MQEKPPWRGAWTGARNGHEGERHQQREDRNRGALAAILHQTNQPVPEAEREMIALETTGLYTRVVIEDLRQVVSRAHPRERPCRRKARRYNSV